MMKQKLYCTLASYAGYYEVAKQLKAAKDKGLGHFQEVPYDVHESSSDWAVFSNYEVTKEEMLSDFESENDLPYLNY